MDETVKRGSMAGIPDLVCGDETLERAFRLALGGMAINTRRMCTGLLREPAPCLMAGLDYQNPWTRDAAINVYFAAGLLEPEVAKNTLLSVLERQENGQVVIGGQYWDRIIWALGAERLWKVTGDEDFLLLAWDAIRRTMEICLQEEFDPADGLFRGPAVYGDGVSAYPEQYRNPSLSSGISSWSEEHPKTRALVGGGVPMKALSTNCIYAHAFQVLAEMTEVLGGDPWPDLEKAEALKKAINRRFWNEEKGTYDYLAGECDAQEGLGIAFAILFGIADEKQTKSICDHLSTTKAGIPCVWPSFHPYDLMGFGRHSGTVWPHVQGFWALAALKAGRGDLFSKELLALARNAVRDQQFAEIYHPETGKIYGGIQEGSGKYMEWKSCAWQTWSATAYLAMILYGIFGLGEPADSTFLPKELAFAELNGLSTGKIRIERKS